MDTGALQRADGTGDHRGLRTPPHAAPEVLLGPGRSRGSASDLYPVGAVAYFLLTRRPPPSVEQRGYLAAAEATLLHCVDLPSRARAHVARHVLTLLAVDPREREVPGATTWARDLTRLATPPVRTATSRRRDPRRRTWRGPIWSRSRTRSTSTPSPSRHRSGPPPSNPTTRPPTPRPGTGSTAPVEACSGRCPRRPRGRRATRSCRPRPGSPRVRARGGVVPRGRRDRGAQLPVPAQPCRRGPDRRARRRGHRMALRHGPRHLVARDDLGAVRRRRRGTDRAHPRGERPRGPDPPAGSSAWVRATPASRG